VVSETIVPELLANVKRISTPFDRALGEIRQKTLVEVA
jgi:hypothetical protein